MFRALQEHRCRIARRGTKRVEVSALASDADLIRRMARVVNKDNEAAGHLRALLPTAGAARPYEVRGIAKAARAKAATKCRLTPVAFS
jgi:hypothetical protein